MANPNHAYAQAVPAPAPASEIDGQMNRLANGLMILESTVEALRSRLTAYICEPPIPDSKAAPREVSGSQFGQMLQTQADRTESVNARLEYLMVCLRV